MRGFREIWMSSDNSRMLSQSSEENSGLKVFVR